MKGEMSVGMQNMTFAGLRLDTADALRGDENWIRARLADSKSRFLPLRGLDPLVDDRDVSRLNWLSASDLVASGLNGRFMVFLGVLNDVAHFAFEVEGEMVIGGGMFAELRAAAAHLAPHEAAAAGRARSLIDWHRRHGFCAQCGKPTEPGRGGTNRRCLNAACGAEHFPRVDPVVIMLITHGDDCLLGRQARFPEGMYSALAGFMEPGETIEEAVRRESLEEVGVRIGAVRYMTSQPWPFPSSLMIGCEAEALGRDLRLDQTEIEDAIWVSRAVVRQALAGDNSLGFFLPPPIAIANHLTRLWTER